MSLIPSPLRRGLEAVIAPLVDRLIARRVSPNTITTLGTLVLVGSGVAFGVARVRLGGTLLLASGVFDMLDGRVARGGGGTTRFGAFYDSTLDRIGETALFGGIIVYFLHGGAPPGWQTAAVLAGVLALGAGLIVSYARARAEGLGLECKVGVAQRAERILGLGAPTLFFGAGRNGWLLFGIVIALAGVASITVAQRILHVRRTTTATAPPRATQARHAVPTLAEYSEKGTSGD